MIISQVIEDAWRLNSVDFNYAKFRITGIGFDKNNRSSII